MQVKKYGKLRGRIREVGLTLSDLARAIGISQASISYKLSGKYDFTLQEIRQICDVLAIHPTEISAYFFDM